mmetsp:Transcript_4697/g.6851  ORF Transcript_4697/g.6851 Transcript_4697/m.6851 type:complete len:267 (-) Transcript_4697:124-924(-)|eukprot:CAMPEP_0116026372 /NCGR_PEP_ID=MMETSP0321-20121206/13788_1 /TAXON_ID=163516 /ORGANISM="Leptocylindrus danicus var. danicus, Strain B650" /LENGTH=266 /DNA_ID=CAMNT_0003499111 /DNA_START=346 /DNA_END=1146 /DNA_ORIENTATION=+
MSDNKETAESKKELGNAEFASKNYKKAIEHYTDGIRLDPHNHILFSNRSACHYSLEDYTNAADDAKECIKLNPAFIKGYYRLIQALIEQKDWDGALGTVRQGLQLDGENSQLLKQLRIITQQKKKMDVAAKQATAMSDARSANIAGSNKEESDEIRELQEQYVATNRELQIINSNIQKSQREQKLADITLGEINKMTSGDDDGRNLYRGVGKMFMLSSRPEVLDHLKKSTADAKKDESDLIQKRVYLQKRISSQQQNLQELIKASR